ncbi:MAG: hypothetical protein OXC48_03255, partial [Endozoicomonadaceae bacterium]|nr:hypothetical protein [Endozoicomonadaceae bacterium]
QPTVRPAKAGIFSKKQTCQSKRLNLKNVTKRQRYMPDTICTAFGVYLQTYPESTGHLRF